MNALNFFSKTDSEIISKAIEKIEKRTGGELVLNVNGKSDDYNEAHWKSGALFMMLYLLIAVILSLYKTDNPWLHNYFVALAGSAVSFFAGTAAAAIIPSYRRIIIGREIMDYYTNLKAHEIFLHEELFKTKQRTGILIYLSLFEKTVVILGDSGINSKVSPDKWETIISEIAAGMQTKGKVQAIVRAVEMCGDLLENAGIHSDKNDSNELSNDVRIGG